MRRGGALSCRRSITQRVDVKKLSKFNVIFIYIEIKIYLCTNISK